jgi:hypothetical protein
MRDDYGAIIHCMMRDLDTDDITGDRVPRCEG